MTRGWTAAVVLAAWAVGCGGDDGPGPSGTDGGGGIDAPAAPDAPTGCSAADTCERHSDCDDDEYCNGEESCVDGCCVAGTAVDCDDGDDCTMDRCDDDDAECVHMAPDEDGDGHLSAACGGDDCDDTDMLRYTGATEVCDPATSRDEDCDPTTIGFRDLDADDAVDIACCNMQPGGELLCGQDCNDMAAGVHPGAPEVCDDVDQDCDGENNEGVTITFHRDEDADGYGSTDTTMDVEACEAPMGYTAGVGDCNDADSLVHPGVDDGCDTIDNDCDTVFDEDIGTEVCDGVDNDCDMMADEGFMCVRGATRACRTSCDPAGMTTGRQTCNASCGWGGCVAPAEVCDGRDNDCNGGVDDAGGYQCVRGTPTSCTTDCGSTGTGTCTATCVRPTGAACTPPAESCNGVDDDCVGGPDNGFMCVSGTSGHMCTTGCGTTGTRTCTAGSCTFGACRAGMETCNNCDDDGDGTPDNGLPCRLGETLSCPDECGATGTGTCYQAGGACTRPDPTLCRRSRDDTLYDGQFVHACGYQFPPFPTVHYTWCYEPGGAGCYAQYGPPGGLTAYARGRYRVTFNVRHDGPAGSTAEIDLSVVGGGLGPFAMVDSVTPGTRIDSNTWRYTLWSGDPSRDIVLEYTIPSGCPTNLEWRVFYRNVSGCMGTDGGLVIASTRVQTI